MLEIKVEMLSCGTTGRITFKNPKCNHPQSFYYCAPLICVCGEKVLLADKLLKNLKSRIKYFRKGEI